MVPVPSHQVKPLLNCALAPVIRTQGSPFGYVPAPGTVVRVVFPKEPTAAKPTVTLAPAAVPTWTSRTPPPTVDQAEAAFWIRVVSLAENPGPIKYVTSIMFALGGGAPHVT